MVTRLGGMYSDLVVLDADLQRATETQEFAEVYPERYFNLGVSEANMIGIAAGLALSGKTVFCGTFSCFITQRVYDQVAISVAYTQANVKLFGFEPALTSGHTGQDLSLQLGESDDYADGPWPETAPSRLCWCGPRR